MIPIRLLAMLGPIGKRKGSTSVNTFSTQSLLTNLIIAESNMTDREVRTLRKAPLNLKCVMASQTEKKGPYERRPLKCVTRIARSLLLSFISLCRLLGK